MRDEWIQGRFEGVTSGTRVEGEASDPRGARRFSFEIVSGEVRDLELVPAPLETDAPGEPKALRQDRIERVSLALMDGDAPRDRPLFDVRIRDWKLLHPAEAGGRCYGTVVGTIEACLYPLPAEPPQLLRVPTPSVPASTRPEEAPSASSRRPTGPGAPSRSTAVEGTDAEVVYARLRWTLALLATGLGAALFAYACGSRAAMLWAAPVAFGLVLRAVTRRVEAGPMRLHGLLGAAVVLGAALGWSEPLLGWWRTGCGTASLPALPWLAAPVVVAGLLRVRWSFALTASGWALVVCATCWQLGGGCPGDASGRGAPAAALALEAGGARLALPTPVAPTPPAVPRRTGPGGRWPADPWLASLGSSLSARPDAALPEADGSGSAIAAAREQAQGRGVQGPAAQTELALRGGTARPPGPDLSPEPLPEPGFSSPPGGYSQPQAAAGALPEGAASSVRRSAAPRGTPGGWVSPDHRRTRRAASRISVEQANRSPADFFGEPRRRVYIPADRLFEPGATRIRAKGELELSRLANLLSLHPERAVVLEVHTGSGGSSEDQLALSTRQAAAIHDWLTSRGHLAQGQLRTRGVGGLEPIVPPDGSHAAQQPNRRIEVRLAD